MIISMSTKKNVKKTKKNIAVSFQPPEYLSEIAKNKWNDLLPLLENKKITNASDLMALEMLCTSYAMSIDLYHAMIAQSEDGTIAGYFKDRNSQTMGEYNAYYKSQATYMRLLTEFGMTPKSRKHINIEAENEDGSDPTRDLIDN